LKILCVSDQIDPLVYSASVKERFSNVDLVLCAGDLPLDYLDFIVSSLNKPLFFVFGNHHTGMMRRYAGPRFLLGADEEEKFEGCGAVYVGSRVAREGGLIIAGLGGSMRYNKGPNQFTDFQMFIEAGKLFPRLLWNRLTRGRWLDILLTHAPPKGVGDKKDKCHSGFKTFLWFMKAFKPEYLVHGHVHLYDMQDARLRRFGSTTVVNACGHYLIDKED
jgi:Icc-related predicted phosphoesterase